MVKVLGISKSEGETIGSPYKDEKRSWQREKSYWKKLFGFGKAHGGLVSMAPEARAMFGKPHSMAKATFAVEPRLTDLGPGTNPGVASLCGVARNMNRSVVA